MEKCSRFLCLPTLCRPWSFAADKADPTVRDRPSAQSPQSNPWGSMGVSGGPSAPSAAEGPSLTVISLIVIAGRRRGEKTVSVCGRGAARLRPLSSVLLPPVAKSGDVIRYMMCVKALHV